MFINDIIIFSADLDKVGKVESRELTGTEDAEHRKQSFKKIFDKNLWGSKSKSGPGSLLTSTVNIRNILDKVIDKVKTHLNKEQIR